LNIERPTSKKALSHHLILNYKLSAEGDRSSKFDVECSMFDVQAFGK